MSGTDKHLLVTLSPDFRLMNTVMCEGCLSMDMMLHASMTIDIITKSGMLLSRQL